MKNYTLAIKGHKSEKEYGRLDATKILAKTSLAASVFNIIHINSVQNKVFRIFTHQKIHVCIKSISADKVNGNFSSVFKRLIEEKMYRCNLCNYNNVFHRN